jgi:hypothetical protein
MIGDVIALIQFLETVVNPAFPRQTFLEVTNPFVRDLSLRALRDLVIVRPRTV